jgi:ubiquinone/menaquinone biosynthesis C-methylase UbiE
LKSTEAVFSASAERNRKPILDVLKRLLPDHGRILEVASGTGQHVVFFADALPNLEWQPSDPDASCRQAITERIVEASLRNVAMPLDLDVLGPWPELSVDAVYVANLLHISAPEVMPALAAGARTVMPEDGLLLIYGPFKRDGQHVSAGNEVFDESLRAQNATWGIRDLETVVQHCEQAGFELDEVCAMPANNFLLSFTGVSQ